MAPRETPKSTQKAQRSLIKTNINKAKSSPVSVKKGMSTKKAEIKMTTTSIETRQRTSTVPSVAATPKPKDSKPVPGSATKSAKKPSWKRRPKPAHSGVPVPEKMRKLFEKQLQADCSF